MRPDYDPNCNSSLSEIVTWSLLVSKQDGDYNCSRYSHCIGVGIRSTYLLAACYIADWHSYQHSTSNSSTNIRSIQLLSSSFYGSQ